MSKSPQANNPIQHLIPMVVTDVLDQTRAYYAAMPEVFVEFDLPNYLQVRFGPDRRDRGSKPSKDAEAQPDRRPALAFMAPEAMGAMPVASVYSGGGLVVSIPVDDADEYAKTLTAAGLSPHTPVADKPWGWRSFLIRDPAGISLDFFHVIADASVDAAS